MSFEAISFSFKKLCPAPFPSCFSRAFRELNGTVCQYCWFEALEPSRCSVNVFVVIVSVISIQIMPLIIVFLIFFAQLQPSSSSQCPDSEPIGSGRARWSLVLSVLLNKRTTGRSIVRWWTQRTTSYDSS